MKKVINTICEKLKIDKKSAVLLIIGMAGVIILVLTLVQWNLRKKLVYNER